MVDSTLGTNSYLGEDDGGEVISLSTTRNCSEIDFDYVNEGMSWDEKFIGVEGYLKEDDVVAGFRIQYLIDALKILQREVDSEYVKVRLNDERPLSLLTKDDEGKMMVGVAPMIEDSLDRGRLSPIENNLLGYHVFCDQRDVCEWVNGRFRTEEAAEKAAQDHRHFTGHRCKINDHEGTVIKDFDEEVDSLEN